MVFLNCHPTGDLTKVMFTRGLVSYAKLSDYLRLYDFSWVLEVSKVDDGRRMLLADVGRGNSHATRSIARSGLPLQRSARPGLHRDQLTETYAVAYVYYIRYCLHDYSNEAAIAILGVIADPMAGDNRLLIAEQVLDDPPSAPTASLDLLMLTVSGKERTEEMWRDVIAAAGLELADVFSAEGNPPAVLECVKPGGGTNGHLGVRRSVSMWCSISCI
ncbi:O-methyltransferase [Colletotrichum chrysophilum]|uniref:O-methyltransferase n=1 Tax=Colletotrichum chrysophilum TaxID=1836956 RepID=A0AAD8ZYI8_9PEZI|nr:O-methyltransferase [Colletotrichum chrysophilum]